MTIPTTRRPRPAGKPVGRPAARKPAARPARVRAHARVAGGPPRAQTRKRLLGLLAFIAMLFAIIAFKVTDLQVLSPQRYLAFGASQTIRSQTLAADRGTIYDRNHVELAMSVPMRTIFADPKLVTDPHGEAQQLAPLLNLQADDLEHKLGEKNRFTYLARKVPRDLADKVAELKLAGVAQLDETDRVSPAGASAQSLIGSVDVDNKGLGGLEQQYGDLLTGRPGSLTLEETPGGHTIPIGEHQLVPAVKGDDLVLTLDRTMQFETERILSEQVQAVGAKGGIAIVSRPSTGEILAMANVETDPTTKQVNPSSNNAAVTTVYEPGSVMKMSTISGALERGLITPDTVIDVPGSLRVADATFTDAEAHGAESMTVAKILSQSSNIGTIKIGQKLGKDGIYQTLTDFGFGTRTSLDFPNEAAGVVLKPDKWSATSIGTIPIGQGISATPLQVLEGYNTLANRGVHVSPRLVDSTIDPDGHEHPIPADEGRRVVSTATADKMNLMLRSVVSEGTGGAAAVDGYTVAGKTGTARKPQPNGGYTDKNGAVHYQSTFVGMVPAEAPALSVIVVIDEPQGSNYYGGAVAAPAFSKIASTGLRQFAVPPPASDLSAGGAPVDPAAAGRSVLKPGPDGKVKVQPAGEPLPGAPTTPAAPVVTSPPATVATKPKTTTSTKTPPSTASPPTTRKP